MKEGCMDPNKDNNQLPADNNPFNQATPIPDAQPAAQITPDVVSVPKKRKTGLIVLISALILALVAAGIYIGLTLLNTKEEPAAQTTAPTSSASDVASLVESVKSNLTGELSSNSSTFAFRLDGNKYLTLPKEGATTSNVESAVTSKSAANNEQKLAEQTLKSEGLTLNSLSEEAVEFNATATYWSSEDAVCQILNSPFEDFANASYTLVVTCANIADYTDTAAAAKPFYDAYAKSSEQFKDNKIFTAAKILDSETSGYKVATITLSSYGATVGGFVGLFYQTPDAAWHYFKGAQGVVNCSDYNTVDLKKAYVGDDCYSTSGQKFVQI